MDERDYRAMNKMNDQNKAMDSRSIEEIIEQVYSIGEYDIGKPSKQQLIEAMQDYAKQAVKLALKKASEEAEIHWPVENNLNPTVNRQHILDLEPEILKELGIE